MPRPEVLLTNPIEPTATRRLAEHCTVNTLEQTDADTIRAAARTAQVVIGGAPIRRRTVGWSRTASCLARRMIRSLDSGSPYTSSATRTSNWGRGWPSAQYGGP